MNHFQYNEIEKGQKAAFSRTVTEEMMAAFRTITGDVNPLHADQEYAAEVGYRGRVVFGMLTASLCSTLVGVYLPGEFSLIHSVNFDFVRPVFVGDVLTVEGVVTNKYDEFKVIKVGITISNQNDEKVCRGRMQIGVLR